MNITNKQYTTIVVGVAFVAMALVTRVRYWGDFELPGKPAKPVETVVNAQEVSDRIALSSGAYRSYLETDAEAFGIPATSERQMSALFPYKSNRERHVLAPGDSAEVLGIKFSLTVERGKGSSTKQMMLSMENLGHKPLAYKVQTRPSSGKGACARTHQVRHNALAIAVGETLKRAECSFRKGRTIDLVEVEIIELPELGFLYLSSMDARNFALDERTANMHLLPVEGMTCRVPQTASLRNAIMSGKVAWRDQADFYARHRCQTYSFPVAYKAFQQDGEHSLPAGGDDL
ncbi:MAG: hypothetical protein GY811_12765 [Myxococcales bacterium]|nr:hypothetical protein [Myxococcales bacterium]